MYPKRLLVAEARRLGIPILPLDINRSGAEYRVERVAEGPDRGKLGIRLSLNGIFGLSGSELKRIVAGQPYRLPGGSAGTVQAEQTQHQEAGPTGCL